LLVRLRKSHTNQPEDHQHQRQETQQHKHAGLAQESREYLLPRQKYGRCSDEQSKTHPPKMPRQTLCARNSPAHQHANIPHGSQHGDETKDKVRPRWIVILEPGRTHRRVEPKGQFDSGDREDNQKRAPIKNSCFLFLAPGGDPRRCHQIERQRASQNIARLGFHDREKGSACRQDQHGYDEHRSREGMSPGAFAQKHRDKS